MGISINPGYRYCEIAKRNILLEQTEGQCRERHNCGDNPCPLESELGQDRFSRALAFLIPNLRDGGAKPG